MRLMHLLIIVIAMFGFADLNAQSTDIKPSESNYQIKAIGGDYEFKLFNETVRLEKLEMELLRLAVKDVEG